MREIPGSFSVSGLYGDESCNWVGVDGWSLLCIGERREREENRVEVIGVR